MLTLYFFLLVNQLIGQFFDTHAMNFNMSGSKQAQIYFAIIRWIKWAYCLTDVRNHVVIVNKADGAS